MDSALRTEIGRPIEWYVCTQGLADNGRPSQASGKSKRRKIEPRQVHITVGTEQDQTQTVR